MPKTVSVKGDGVSQTVHIHIHEKSDKKKRKLRRKKASSSGAIRNLNRMIPATSSVSGGMGMGVFAGIPQRRLAASQQLLVLPEGDKALGQIGMVGYKDNTYQKNLMRLAIKEYEEEVKGVSSVARDKPVMEIIDLTGDMPIKKSGVKISKLGELNTLLISTVLAQPRRSDAIKQYKIDTSLPQKSQSKAIKKAHAEDVEQNVSVKNESFIDTSSPINSPPSNPLGTKNNTGKKTSIPFPNVFT